jgi:hypothetical protein
MLFLLKLKTAYLENLPWLFCALAHPNEAVARDYASRIRDSWLLNPHPEMHHRVTADLMQNEEFMAGLEAFINGTPRSECNVVFRERIAAFRFVPVVETSIESKHARTTLARRMHHLGPVRISLANRLPFLERAVRVGHISPVSLLEQFHKARSLALVPGCFRVCL